MLTHSPLDMTKTIRTHKFPADQFFTHGNNGGDGASRAGAQGQGAGSAGDRAGAMRSVGVCGPFEATTPIVVSRALVPQRSVA